MISTIEGGPQDKTPLYSSYFTAQGNWVTALFPYVPIVAAKKISK